MPQPVLRHDFRVEELCCRRNVRCGGGCSAAAASGATGELGPKAGLSLPKSFISSPMYQTPTNADFQRNLSTVIQETRDQAHADHQRITHEHASKGLGLRGSLIVAVTARFDELHARMTEAVMHLIRDFVVRTQLTPTELGAAARPQLENLAAEFCCSHTRSRRWAHPASDTTNAG
jgi:hypothetical protein